MSTINKQPVRDGQELVNKVAEYADWIPPQHFTVDRNGKQMDFKVVIEERSKVWEDEPQVSGNRVRTAHGPELDDAR